MSERTRAYSGTYNAENQGQNRNMASKLTCSSKEAHAYEQSGQPTKGTRLSRDQVTF